MLYVNDDNDDDDDDHTYYCWWYWYCFSYIVVIIYVDYYYRTDDMEDDEIDHDSDDKFVWVILRYIHDYKFFSMLILKLIVPDCIGLSVAAAVSTMKDGDVILLENVRFYAEEEKNDPAFAKELSKFADLYVNDAFGTAHRAHASTEGVTSFLSPSVAGLLLQKELDYLQNTINNPKRPFAAIVGGSKVSSKISVIESMLSKVDKLVLGGGMVFTFLKAKGYNVGNSLVEDDQIKLAQKLEILAKEKNVELFLAKDIVIADKFASDANTQIVNIDAIPNGWMGLDIGPETILDIQNNCLENCKTILWNGPMGVFEFDKFANGTNAIAITLADLTSRNNCITIIGGGDSVAAVEKIGLGDKMSHISTGGGASLELLEGKILPGIAALDDA